LGLVARHVMKLLIEKRFDELEEAASGGGLSAAEMEDAIEDVGGSLVMPPESYWRTLQVSPIRNWPGAHGMNLHLWLKNGRTRHVVDLTIQVDGGRPVIEVNDITRQ
jgi:hypothetical protein